MSNSTIKELSEFTGVPIADLVLELVKVFARPDSAVAGSIWLAFASLVCSEADDGQGQLVLKRLLSSDAASLANNVVDGAWVEGRYPASDFCEIGSALVWRVLGSPYAVDRWRAAHSIRAFANFSRWDVIDKLVGRIGAIGAGPFQASELPFFNMHAQLWLLIALARVALDYPAEIASYKEELLSIALDEIKPHALMRHFAANALLACVDARQLKLHASEVKRLRNVDQSPHRRLKQKVGNNGGPYSERPKSAPRPPFEFHLDHDFEKYDVNYLAQVFGQTYWKVADLISEDVHSVDPDVESMYNSPGRESRYRDDSYGMTKRYHTYGQQLGWHGLFVAAGKLLKTIPVTDDGWSGDDPWGEWFRRYRLTRDDGLWLSDGTDATPLDTVVFLLEQKRKGLAVTGDPDRIRALAMLDKGVGKEVVVHAGWSSADGVKVRVSSALVSPGEATKLARSLTREEPMFVWLPEFDEGEDGGEFLRNPKKQGVPWIVTSYGEARLDEHDPFGASVANARPRLARQFTELASLSPVHASSL